MTIVNTENVADKEIKRKVYNPKTDGDMPDYEPQDEDEMGLRVLELNGKKYNVVVKEPHGHFFIKPDKGRCPDELSGAYTSFGKAEMAIKQYLSKQAEKK